MSTNLPSQNSIKIVFSPEDRLSHLCLLFWFMRLLVSHQPMSSYMLTARNLLFEPRPDFLAKGPFFTSPPSANWEDTKSWCLTHEGDRGNNWLMGRKSLKMKGLYVHVNYNFYQPWSLCILSCHWALLLCASKWKNSPNIPKPGPAHNIQSRELDSKLRLASLSGPLKFLYPSPGGKVGSLPGKVR